MFYKNASTPKVIANKKTSRLKAIASNSFSTTQRQIISEKASQRLLPILRTLPLIHLTWFGLFKHQRQGGRKEPILSLPLIPSNLSLLQCSLNFSDPRCILSDLTSSQMNGRELVSGKAGQHLQCEPTSLTVLLRGWVTGNHPLSKLT